MAAGFSQSRAEPSPSCSPSPVWRARPGARARSGRPSRRPPGLAAVRVPDGLLARRFLRPDQLRVREHLLEKRGRIAVGRLDEVAALVSRDLHEKALRYDRARLLVRNLLRTDPVVAVLDEEPGWASLAAAARSNENEAAVQLLAVEHELELAPLERRVDVRRLGHPVTAVPDHHRTAAVLS